MKFKSGDKVRVVKFSPMFGDVTGEWLQERGVKLGDIYTIDYRHSHGDVYYMRELCPNGSVPVQLYTEEMEHARVKYTRLAEKIYSKGYKEGEWWILA